VPERVFYMSLPVEGMRAMNPPRPEPPLVAPQAKSFTVRIPFTPEDLQAAARSATCHRSQITAEGGERVGAAMARAWAGGIPLIPAFKPLPGTDLFRWLESSGRGGRSSPRCNAAARGGLRLLLRL